MLIHPMADRMRGLGLTAMADASARDSIPRNAEHRRGQ